MNNEFIAALEDLERQKGIPQYQYTERKRELRSDEC